MAITDKINEIIDRRIGRNGFEGKGHLEIIKKKKEFFEGLSRLMDEYSTLRETILSQIKEQKGEYYVMSVEDPTFQDKVELADPSAFMLQPIFLVAYSISTSTYPMLPLHHQDDCHPYIRHKDGSDLH